MMVIQTMMVDDYATTMSNTITITMMLMILTMMILMKMTLIITLIQKLWFHENHGAPEGPRNMIIVHACAMNKYMHVLCS